MRACMCVHVCAFSDLCLLVTVTDSGSTEATQVGAQSQTSLETTTGESLSELLLPLSLFKHRIQTLK